MEDFYLPVRGTDTSTRIDTTPGLQYDGIADVEYLREKMFAALKVPKAYFGYEGDLQGKATLAAEDIRFARTVERIQRIMESELTKIALVHLYTQGYKGESLTNFEISLTNPSIVYEQERIMLMKEKMDLASTMVDSKLFSTEYVYENLFSLSDDKIIEMRDLIRQDGIRGFRMAQIENEGNDPAETGVSFGTPHDLASLYGRRASSDNKVPVGYDESETLGRPIEKASKIGTQDDPLGQDRLGAKDNRGGYDQTPDKLREASNQRTKSIFFKNKDMFEPKKTFLFESKEEESKLLDESNIKDLED